METDKRVEALEGEFKLMRGELKETLSSVRDYLINLKLPPSQEAALLAAAISSGGGSDVSMDGKFTFGRDDNKNLPGKDELPDEQPAEGDEPPETEPEIPETSPETSEDKMEEGKTATEESLSVPPVNLLANLIRWVANAKKEIGSEQLATFLEVYGISGYLSPELKETILHLADITAAAEPANDSTADTWSQLMLELHGILGGGAASLRPLGALWNNGGNGRRVETDKPKPKPSKLKLVLSSGDGTDKEFSLDLKPDEE